MVNKPKNIGTRGETKVVNYLLKHGIEAQRRALSGAEDKGDVEYITEYDTISSFVNNKPVKKILEVKAGKQTQNYSRGTKEEWLHETKVEAVNAGTDAHLVIVVFNKSIENAEVWSKSGNRFWYLDEFVKEIGGKP